MLDSYNKDQSKKKGLFSLLIKSNDLTDQYVKQRKLFQLQKLSTLKNENEVENQSNFLEQNEQKFKALSNKLKKTTVL